MVELWSQGEEDGPRESTEKREVDSDSHMDNAEEQKQESGGSGGWFSGRTAAADARSRGDDGADGEGCDDKSRARATPELSVISNTEDHLSLGGRENGDQEENPKVISEPETYAEGVPKTPWHSKSNLHRGSNPTKATSGRRPNTPLIPESSGPSYNKVVVVKRRDGKTIKTTERSAPDGTTTVVKETTDLRGNLTVETKMYPPSAFRRIVGGGSNSSSPIVAAESEGGTEESGDGAKKWAYSAAQNEQENNRAKKGARVGKTCRGGIAVASSADVPKKEVRPSVEPCSVEAPHLPLTCFWRERPTDIRKGRKSAQAAALTVSETSAKECNCDHTERKYKGSPEWYQPEENYPPGWREQEIYGGAPPRKKRTGGRVVSSDRFDPQRPIPAAMDAAEAVHQGDEEEGTRGATAGPEGRARPTAGRGESPMSQSPFVVPEARLVQDDEAAVGGSPEMPTVVYDARPASKWNIGRRCLIGIALLVVGAVAVAVSLALILGGGRSNSTSEADPGDTGNRKGAGENANGGAGDATPHPAPTQPPTDAITYPVRSCGLCPGGYGPQFPDAMLGNTTCGDFDAWMATIDDAAQCRIEQNIAFGFGSYPAACGYCRHPPELATSLCTLCVDGSLPAASPFTVTVAGDVGGMTCAHAAWDALHHEARADDCADARLRYGKSCGCPLAACPICPDGKDVPDADSYAPSFGGSCGDLATIAADPNIVAEECSKLQRISVDECGCNFWSNFG